MTVFVFKKKKWIPFLLFIQSTVMYISCFNFMFSLNCTKKFYQVNITSLEMSTFRSFAICISRKSNITYVCYQMSLKTTHTVLNLHVLTHCYISFDCIYNRQFFTAVLNESASTVPKKTLLMIFDSFKCLMCSQMSNKFQILAGSRFLLLFSNFPTISIYIINK